MGREASGKSSKQYEPGLLLVETDFIKEEQKNPGQKGSILLISRHSFG